MVKRHQFLFNEGIRERMKERVELLINKVLKDLEDIKKQGEDIINERKHKLRVADDLG